MADKQVTVAVDILASGNMPSKLGQYATDADLLAKKVASASDMIRRLDASMGSGKMATGFGAAGQAWRAGLPTGDFPTASVKVDAAAQARALADANQQLDRTARVLAGGFALMIGAVAAAGPAALGTFTSAVQQAAGELGIAFIPVIVELAGWFRDLAGTIRFVNDLTFGWAGKIVGVTVVFGVIFAAAWKAAGALDVLTGAANRNAVSQATGGAAGATGGLAGSFRSAGRIGVAAGGIVAGGVIRDAVGGQGGNLLGGAVEGAALGFMVGGPIGAAIGAAGGALVAGLQNVFGQATNAFDRLSLGFQGGTVALEDTHDILQQGAVRDPAGQARFEQEMRAIQSLVETINSLSGSVRGINQFAG